jgi:hypothetical protein
MTDGGVELRDFCDAYEPRVRGEEVVDVEADEFCRIAVALSTEECAVGGEAEPSLGNESRTDEEGGEAEAE